MDEKANKIWKECHDELEPKGDWTTEMLNTTVLVKILAELREMRKEKKE